MWRPQHCSWWTQRLPNCYAARRDEHQQSTDATISLVLKTVTKRFGDLAAVSGVDFEIAEGEFVSFLGPSGCGKTTLLRLIAGLEIPDGGQIELHGRDLSGSLRASATLVWSFSLVPYSPI